MNSRTINQQLMLFMIKPLLWVKKTENQVLVLKDFLQLTEVATGCVELPRSGSRDCWMPCHSASCSQKQMMWSNGAQTRRKCWALWCQAWKSKDWESHEADCYNPQQEPGSPTMWEVCMKCRIQGTPCVSSYEGACSRVQFRCDVLGCAEYGARCGGEFDWVDCTDRIVWLPY